MCGCLSRPRDDLLFYSIEDLNVESAIEFLLGLILFKVSIGMNISG